MRSTITPPQQLKASTDLSAEEKIANFVKGTLRDTANEDTYKLMARHFRQMKLLDQQDKWAPGLEDIAEKLLPKNVSVSDFETLVDQMAVCAARNPYLHRVVEEAEKQNLGDWFVEKSQEKEDTLPDVVAYAMVLNNLTVTMRNDIGVVKICMDLWIKERKKVSVFTSNFGSFEWLKLLGLGRLSLFYSPIVSRLLDSDCCKYVLPLNILEATLTDTFNGNFNNAYAGWILAKNRPGGEIDAVTGAGPATFSSDGKAISLHMPFEKKWADLYTVWNLGFALRYKAFPYLTKLLIPQVNDYEKAPGEYMYNRVLALYTTLNFMCFANPELPGNVRLESFNWKNQELINAFGTISAESAKEYQAEVDKFSTRNECFSRCANFYKILF